MSASLGGVAQRAFQGLGEGSEQDKGWAGDGASEEGVVLEHQEGLVMGEGWGREMGWEGGVRLEEGGKWDMESKWAQEDLWQTVAEQLREAKVAG